MISEKGKQLVHDYSKAIMVMHDNQGDLDAVNLAIDAKNNLWDYIAKLEAENAHIDRLETEVADLANHIHEIRKTLERINIVF